MIPTDKKYKLIKIYFYVCNRYNEELKYLCQRFTNNNEPEFTDQEAITIYLYAMHLESRHNVKHIHEFASEYLRDWFPKLPSYEAFTTRINRLCEVFRALSETILTDFIPVDCDQEKNLIDSMPVIICSGKRIPKVATEIIDKGFCSTKGMYYHGLKLHALGFYHKGFLPHPEQLIFSKASENDLTFLKSIAPTMKNRTYFGDKIYCNGDYWAEMEKTNNSRMLTPIKDIKGQPDELKQRDKAYNDLFSKAVSSVRQPIESLFNWLIEKTDIQKASKVRSTKGLLTFVFGRIAAAFIYLIF
jgi:hypothetical protein